ncbi:uncharacterized protein [Eurosta solidaginis]|uniref:uncharacterized protein n=1 Tax=Eurosta solidaginis TaxID=178769 RepID=UPI003530F8BD
MQIMKSPTIWESASRPLFVRSVWLEAPKIGRAGPQRHFILDYEPKRRSALTKSAANSCRSSKVYATLQHSNSYDFAGDWRDYQQCSACSEHLPTDLLLIVPAKVEHIPTTAGTTQFQPTTKHTLKPLSSTCRTQKRPTIFLRNRAPENGPLHELYAFYSRHSSLQDLQSSLSQAHSHADERLAERVLNWLDLAAGKGEQAIQPTQPQELQEMLKNRQKKTTVTKTGPAQATRVSGNVTTTSSNKLQRAATAQASTKFQPTTTAAQSQTRIQSPPAQPPAPQSATQTRKQVRYANATRTTQSTSNNTTSQAAAQMSQQQPTLSRDAVKHVTIIFDREGVPVRFNRPVRNIDLCSLSASPDTVRRLAGTLASARLYSEVETPQTNAVPRIMSSRVRSSSDASKSVQRRTHDTSINDAKKQLHIFMPNLPKKNLLTAIDANESVCGSADDTLSGLSNAFSELCKI